MEPTLDGNQMVPPCAHCGSPRVFEFQLMPALVSLLHCAHSRSGLSDEFCIEYYKTLDLNTRVTLDLYNYSFYFSFVF